MLAKIFTDFYFHPRRSTDVLAQQRTPLFGAIYTLLRGLLLSLFYYLPFYLLNFQPVTPVYLDILDTPNYFLYAAIFWPLFGLLSWVYLEGIVYVVLRLLGYPANFDQILNLDGLISLAIGIVLILFDWLMVALSLLDNVVLIGIAHILIADPWSIAVTSLFYRKFFGVPVWLSIGLGILVRVLFIPLAVVLVRI